MALAGLSLVMALDPTLVSHSWADDRLLLNVTLDGQDIRLAFDTGASHATLFLRAAERLKLKLNPPPSKFRDTTASGVLGLTDSLVLRQGNNTIETNFVVVDLPAGVSPDVDGLMGWTNVRDNILEIGQGTFRALSAVPRDAAATWQAVPIKRENMLFLEVAFEDGTKGLVLVDTGDPHGVRLDEAFWERWISGRGDATATMAAIYSPQTGLNVSSEMWAKEVELGDLKLTEVPVSSHRGLSKLLPGLVAQIGLYGVGRLQMIVDGANNVAYLRPNEAAPVAYNHNRLGAVFVPRDLNSDPLLARVAKGSPADRSGIRDGDILKKIGELDVTGWRTTPGVMPLSRFFEKPPGTVVKLTIERDGREQVLSVTLENILGP